MKDCVKKCLGELIVSCQAYEDTPMYGPVHIRAFVLSAVLGGAKVLRCCWKQDIEAVRDIEGLTIIGISKVFKENGTDDDIFITPTFEDAKEVIEAGADIIALDARITPKRGKDELLSLLKQIHESYPNVGIMADCKTYEEGVFAAESGYVDIVATTLSGMGKELHHPDYKLIRKFKENLNLPINAEGHVWELGDLDLVNAAGADMVTVGSAITRPHLITQRFTDYYKQITNE